LPNTFQLAQVDCSASRLQVQNQLLAQVYACEQLTFACFTTQNQHVHPKKKHYIFPDVENNGHQGKDNLYSFLLPGAKIGFPWQHIAQQRHQSLPAQTGVPE